MEPTAQLPAMLTALMFSAMLAGFIQVIAANRKGRHDRRRYQQRMKCNHGGSRAERQAPPKA